MTYDCHIIDLRVGSTLHVPRHRLLLIFFASRMCVEYMRETILRLFKLFNRLQLHERNRASAKKQIVYFPSRVVLKLVLKNAGQHNI